MKHLITALLVLLLGVGTVEAALTTYGGPSPIVRGPQAPATEPAPQAP